MSKSLQNICEEKAYDILFDLEDELELEINTLPEICHISNKTKFSDIGLGKDYFEGFSIVKKTKKPIFIPDKKIIFLKNPIDLEIAEEVAHFMHFNYTLPQENIIDIFSQETLSEMIGYFCSKLVDSKRISTYKGDNFRKLRTSDELASDIIKSYKQKYSDYLIHQQGYSLGEKLFNYYISNIISKKEIKEIIKNPLKKRGDAFWEFINWKYEILK